MIKRFLMAVLPEPEYVQVTIQYRQDKLNYSINIEERKKINGAITLHRDAFQGTAAAVENWDHHSWVLDCGLVFDRIPGYLGCGGW